MQGLYYVGVMQLVVRGLGWVVQRTLGATLVLKALLLRRISFWGKPGAPLVVCARM